VLGEIESLVESDDSPIESSNASAHVGFYMNAEAGLLAPSILLYFSRGGESFKARLLTHLKRFADTRGLEYYGSCAAWLLSLEVRLIKRDNVLTARHYPELNRFLPTDGVTYVGAEIATHFNRDISWYYRVRNVPPALEVYRYKPKTDEVSLKDFKREAVVGITVAEEDSFKTNWDGGGVPIEKLHPKRGGRPPPPGREWAYERKARLAKEVKDEERKR
jgi:hypothetical protein